MTGTRGPLVRAGSAAGPDSVSGVGCTSPRCTRTSFPAVRSSTATPSSRVETTSSWLASATSYDSTRCGLSPAPAGAADAGADGSLAAVIAETVPWLGTAIQSRPLPSKVPPVMPGG